MSGWWWWWWRWWYTVMGSGNKMSIDLLRRLFNQTFERTMKVQCVLQAFLPTTLTNPMKHSSSWEANSPSPSQKMRRILWTPKVHHRLNNRLPPVLSHSNPVHAFASHFLKTHFNIVHPSAPSSSMWSLSLRFPHQIPVRNSPVSHTCYIPRPSHSSWFDNPNNTW